MRIYKLHISVMLLSRPADYSVDIVRRDAALVTSLFEAGLEVGHSLQLGTRVEVWDYTVYWEAYRQRVS
jgi:hypothetical protein